MPRSVNAVASRARRKKILKATKGYFGARNNVLTVAKHSLEKAMQYAYRDRKSKKRAFRRLWIARINAAARQNGISYSKLINALHKNQVELNRKVLADMAMNQPDVFKAILNSVK
ncbi:MAG: 50S ribosomal protein L20 [Saprospiraceae bacterium]|nr:50S ribosomal protein L20 [Saprospiraceae bacterium]